MTPATIFDRYERHIDQIRERLTQVDVEAYVDVIAWLFNHVPGEDATEAEHVDYLKMLQVAGNYEQRAANARVIVARTRF